MPGLELPFAPRMRSLVSIISIVCCLLATQNIEGLPAGQAPRNVRAATDTATIQITGLLQPPGYAPVVLAVHVYDTIVFSNMALPAASYTVVSDDGSFSSPPIAYGSQWTVTFNSPGTHQYHDALANQRMVGVILVVAGSVSLLPTPAPAAQATVLAYIKAGKSPPDTIWQQPSPTPPRSSPPTRPPGGSVLAAIVRPAILILGILLGLVGLGIGGLYFYRRYKSRKKNGEDEEDDFDDFDDEGDLEE